MKKENIINNLYNEARKLADKGKFPESIKKYEEIINIDPDNILPPMLHNYGWSLMKLQKYEESIEKFKECQNSLNKLNYSAIIKEEVEKLRIRLLHNWSTALMHLGLRENNILKYYEEIEGKYCEILSNKSAYAKSRYSEIYSNWGILLFEMKRFEESFQILNKATTSVPNLGAFNNLGILFYVLGDYAKSIKNFEKAGVHACYEVWGWSLESTKEEVNIKEARNKYIKSFLDLKDNVDVDNKTFFRFRKFNQYTLSEIIDGYLFCVHPVNYNDPFDCPLDPYPDSYKKIASGIRVCSFSSIVDDKSNPEKNVLMWSHYADNHTGICIEYEIGTNRVDNFGIHQVKYRDEMSFKRDRFFELKNHDWRYENECRVIHWDKNNIESEKPHNLELRKNNIRIKSIIFGLRCSETNISTIKNLIKNNKDLNDISLYKMKKSCPKTKFTLEKVDI